MSKLNSAILDQAVTNILAFAAGEEVKIGGEEKQGKKRNFTETVECQITLKNYDPVRDKRFSGTFKLPSVPRPGLKCCVLGNAAHCEQADRIGVDHMSVEDLKRNNILVLGVEGQDASDWILIDCEDLVINIMNNETRLYYDLEALWGYEDATLNSNL